MQVFSHTAGSAHGPHLMLCYTNAQALGGAVVLAKAVKFVWQ